MRTTARVLMIGVMAGLVSGCENPLRPVPLTETERGLNVLTVLDPDEPVQLLLITTIDVGGSLESLRVDIANTDGPVYRLAADPEPGELDPCISRYSVVLAVSGDVQCLELSFRPIPAETYTVTIRASERPTARATVTIPGEFEMDFVEANGSPPGTGGLHATWTASSQAHRYVIGLRPNTLECSGSFSDCVTWGTETTGTVLDTEIPESSFAVGRAPWYLDVIAMERQTYDYLTSGTGNWTFGVPPIQNVSGGFGLIGAWLKRSVKLE